MSLAVVEPGPTDIGHAGRCNAVVRQQPPEGGKRCAKTAGWGTDHPGVGACRLHGGSTPSGRKHAQRRQLEGRIGDLLDEYRQERTTVDAHEELLAVVKLTGGMVWVLEQLVDELGLQVGGDATGVFGADHHGDARPHVLVSMLGDWADRHMRACKTALDAGIEEREVRIVESQAQQLAGMLRAVAAGVLDLVRADVSAGRLRELEGAMPGLFRRVIEGARVVEVSNGRSE